MYVAIFNQIDTSIYKLQHAMAQGCNQTDAAYKQIQDLLQYSLYYT